MEKFIISKIMREEHASLQKMINKAVDGFEISKKECESIYEDFVKGLERHFAMEEKAIYSISQKMDNELQSLIRKIFKDHEDMRAQVKSIETSMQEDKSVKLSEFLSVFRSHHTLEDSKLYPRLDRELSQDDKNIFKKEYERYN